MPPRTSSSWFYPKPTGDPGRDRNARTLQIACFLLASAVSLAAVLNVIEREPQEIPLLLFAAAGLIAATVMNRVGRTAWAARTAFLALLLTAAVMVFEARDGFRSHAMLIFPGVLLLSVLLLDRIFYVTIALLVLLTVAGLGTAERQGLTRAVPHWRTSTTYEAIFFVDLTLLVFAAIGSRIARDAQSNVTDLRNMVQQLSAANAALTASSEALRESEGKYRRLHESITDAVVGVDMFGHILETNPTFESMLGFTGEELRRLTYQDLTPERWQALETQIVAEQVVPKGHSEVYEKEYRKRDGTIFPVELRRYLLRNEHGQPIGMWAIIRDISGRKRDERAISEGEQRLRIAKDAAKLGIYEYDIETGSLLWDARVRELWGVDADVPVTIDTFFSGLHPEDRDRIKAILDRALDPAGNGEYYAEYRAIGRTDGIERWMAATGQVFFENGQPTHMIGTGQDISDRKRAEAALRESEERFRRVFEEGPLGLALVSSNYRFLKINNALCQMVGYAQEELLQKTVPEITHADDLPGCIELTGQLFRREIPHYRTQKRYLKKNGEIVWVNLTASLLRDFEGQGMYGLAMIEDITEIKRTQEEALARHKLESVGTLANGIAHDFNNILGAVEAQAELALAEVQAGSGCQQELTAISEAAMRGSEIVRQLMIYAGKESEAAGVADLSEIVEQMIPLLKVFSKHAVMTYDLDRDLPPTRTGGAQIRQILMNLITNASDAIGERDGIIRVTTRRARAGEESAASSKTLPDVVLEVSDTGAGMSPETQGRVFDPFFTTKSPGRGLGLAVVSGIVRSLGGTIRLRSELGKGTAFQILLPGAEPSGKAMQNAPADSETPTEERNGMVLIVEDEDVLREAVAKMLRKTGFAVLEAADGFSAIEVLRANRGKVDAILLDMTIPGASSQEVVAEAASSTPHSRVILTSAYSQERFAGAISAPRIAGFIRKPFHIADLVKAVRQALV